MKKLLLIFILIAFPLFVFSYPFIDTTNKKLTLGESDRSQYGSICIEGYRFAWIKTGGRNGVALVQIFSHTGNDRKPPQPIKCK